MTTQMSSTPVLSASSMMTRRQDFCEPSRSTSVWSGSARWPRPAAVMTALRTFIRRNYVRRRRRRQAGAAPPVYTLDRMTHVPGSRIVWLVLLVAAPAVIRDTRAVAAPSAPNVLVCIADDWSWPHAGAYADRVVKTPTFDRVAREGVLFTRAFCAAPSCTPSRAAILTGQAPHRLEAGGNLWGYLPPKFVVYPDALEAAGYAVGFTGKGWGPGSNGERKRNPAGPRSPS